VQKTGTQKSHASVPLSWTLNNLFLKIPHISGNINYNEAYNKLFF
jgi:hypothetical protein